jgi:hypothetical protein
MDRPEQLPNADYVRLAFKYGDVCDLMLMLDMKLGGGVMDAVNEGQRIGRISEA